MPLHDKMRTSGAVASPAAQTQAPKPPPPPAPRYGPPPAPVAPPVPPQNFQRPTVQAFQGNAPVFSPPAQNARPSIPQAMVMPRSPSTPTRTPVTVQPMAPAHSINQIAPVPQQPTTPKPAPTPAPPIPTVPSAPLPPKSIMPGAINKLQSAVDTSSQVQKPMPPPNLPGAMPETVSSTQAAGSSLPQMPTPPRKVINVLDPAAPPFVPRNPYPASLTQPQIGSKEQAASSNPQPPVDAGAPPVKKYPADPYREPME